MKIEESYERIPFSGCWIWTRHVDYKGYGRIHRKNKENKTHRFFYEEVKGKIPPNMTLDHLCRVRCCINPDHMEVVSSIENVLRGTGITATNKRKDRCVNGHLFTPENTSTREKGRRRCKTCTNITSRKSKAKARAKRKGGI